MHIGLLNKTRQGNLELKIEENKLVTVDKREFSTFMQDFFLAEKSISLIVQGEKVELIPFEVNFKLSRNISELRVLTGSRSQQQIFSPKFTSSSMNPFWMEKTTSSPSLMTDRILWGCMLKDERWVSIQKNLQCQVSSSWMMLALWISQGPAAKALTSGQLWRRR